MYKYVLKRLVLMVFTFFVIMTMCFVLIKMLPLPAIKEMGRLFGVNYSPMLFRLQEMNIVDWDFNPYL